MGRREGTDYHLSADELERFRSDGWVKLHGLLSGDELRPLELVYERFLSREIEVPGRDFCDMSSDYEKPLADFSILNVMLPRRYFPNWVGNLYEQRAASVARQLCGPDMCIDYDQLIAKRPHKADAVFHWHQDLGYWPVTPDTRTASFWLALDATTLENGCMRFVSGSHTEPKLRAHEPMLGDRSKSHTLVAHVDEARERVVAALLARGDATVHHERTVHGSGGNSSDGWRRGYVMAFRSQATVAEERARGFTHSHNDALEVLTKVGQDR
ncbi:MAG: phytanoyl-CoA dioxygenase family protein [Planctomycetes bacterium]|nr:phytanoyl-CoA dioxygenase family protein [Planctomycetota bacterium]